jgi:hypothetical protein
LHKEHETHDDKGRPDKDFKKLRKRLSEHGKLKKTNHQKNGQQIAAGFFQLLKYSSKERKDKESALIVLGHPSPSSGFRSQAGV